MLPADGREHQLAKLSSRHGSLHAEELRLSGVPSWRVRAEQESPSVAAVFVLSPVQPGKLSISVADSSGRVVLPVTLLPDNADFDSDGTPDWMRLHSAEDRRAFRRWFVTLVDRVADTPDRELASGTPEIIDCASLLRYAYRESLRVHDDKWYAQFSSEQMPSLPSIKQWSYPNTPLGTGLFRTRPGPYVPADVKSSIFAQFADAKTLQADNTFRVGRDVHSARPGDLIFYRVLETDSQYHSMVITGERGEWVVYHTGPIHGHRGEMRRVLMADLLHHPDPRWRPEANNPNFLGVYRWNILRED